MAYLYKKLLSYLCDVLKYTTMFLNVGLNVTNVKKPYFVLHFDPLLTYTIMFKDGPQDGQDVIHISLEANQKSWKGKGNMAFRCKRLRKTCPRPRSYPHFLWRPIKSHGREKETRHSIVKIVKKYAQVFRLHGTK